MGLHRAAWLLYADPQLAREGVLVVGPNRVFIASIAQVLPALGEQSVEQRPIDGLVSRRPWAVGEPEERATLLGSGRLAAVMARLLWARVGPPPEPVDVPVGRVVVTLTPGDVADAIAEARERRASYQPARERFRERLADRVATRVMTTARGGRDAEPEAVASAVRQTKEYQRLATGCWPRVTPDSLADVKGFEFDAAVVVEPAAISAERPDGGRGGLYTALTRSTRALAVVHAQPLPAELAAADDLHVIRDPAGWASHRRG